MTTPIEDIPGLSAQRVQRLQQHWITTAEKVAELGLNRRIAPRLAERLGMSANEVGAVAEAARLASQSPHDPNLAANRRRYGLGLVLPARQVKILESQDPFAPAFLTRTIATRGLPRSVNLIDQMQPIRDQGERGTCVAFSSVAMREFMTRREHELSEQFFYWACKQRDGTPNESGTSLKVAARIVRNEGVCRQASCCRCSHCGV